MFQSYNNILRTCKLEGGNYKKDNNFSNFFYAANDGALDHLSETVGQWVNYNEIFMVNIGKIEVRCDDCSDLENIW